MKSQQKLPEMTQQKMNCKILLISILCKYCDSQIYFVFMAKITTHLKEVLSVKSVNNTWIMLSFSYLIAILIPQIFCNCEDFTFGNCHDQPFFENDKVDTFM